MQQRIVEFFQFIYESFREDVPEFLVVAHEFRIRHALRNLDEPATQAVLAKEKIYGDKIKALEENYIKVSGIIANTPESLQPAMLKIISASVGDMLTDMSLDTTVITSVNGELADILNDYENVTPDQLQQAQGVLQQILAAQSQEQPQGGLAPDEPEPA